MADRAANREGVATRLFAFARSLVLLAVVAVVAPALLTLAARERFGGGSPLHGVAAPVDWSADRVRSALTDRLTDQTIADIVIRLSLVVAWVAVAVLVLTVVAEVGHMLRHGGLAMPDVRGLGMSQRVARVIASGLLAIVPLFTAPAGALADGTAAPALDRAAATPVVDSPSPQEVSTRGSSAPDGLSDLVDPADSRDTPTARGTTPGHPPVETPSTSTASARAVSGQYVVQPGDSVFGIAERIVGPESGSVAAFAEQLVELNLGRRMPDGRHFDNAAFIDVGWVLELPSRSVPGSDPSAVIADAEPSDGHLVRPGESLWSIADEELGDPLRWPEVYEANEGRTFDDGTQLTDPDLIRPGWDLELPVDQQVVVDPPVTSDDTPVVSLTEPEPDAPPDPAVEPDVPSRFLDSLEPGAAVERRSRGRNGGRPTGPPRQRVG